MNPSLLSVLGGLGLFLFGIHFMTQGLHQLSGQQLHAYLTRAASTPAKGALTGGLITAFLQSSSATSVAVVGFTGAGLLTFEQGLGIIIGANVGTTLTGWIVAIFGIKFKLATLSLLILFLASLLRLITRKRSLEAVADALTGFSLLFLGIDFLQDGLRDAQSWITIPRGIGTSISGRFIFLGIGILLTIITQSSSATIATALTAISTGLIGLPEALALSVGADIGTTGTALLATVGSSTSGRRTGVAHVIYNLFTGILAFSLITPYLHLVERFIHYEATFATVAFHSGFNILGTLLILPFTKHFARLIKHIIPPRKDSLTRELIPSLLSDPEASYQAINAVTHRVAATAFSHLAKQTKEDHLDLPQLESLTTAIEKIRHFLSEIGCESLSEKQQHHFANLLHAVDHLDRIIDRCRDSKRSQNALHFESLSEETAQLHQHSRSLTKALLKRDLFHQLLASLSATSQHLEDDDQGHRQQIIQAATLGQYSPIEADQILDAYRWLRRTTWHAWRIASYLSDRDPPK